MTPEERAVRPLVWWLVGIAALALVVGAASVLIRIASVRVPRDPTRYLSRPVTVQVVACRREHGVLARTTPGGTSCLVFDHSHRLPPLPAHLPRRIKDLPTREEACLAVMPPEPCPDLETD
jgi:hypothetical protein